MTKRINVSVLKLLILTLILHGATSSDIPNFVGKSCEEKNSYISGSVFEANLNDTLFTQLLPKSSAVKFSNFTIGFDEDQVYALFLCKGDVDAQTCQDCVEAATTKIKNVCEFWKEGIVWYKDCTLRYANQTIFSIDDEHPSSLYTNDTGKVSDYILDPYQEIFDSTMETLIQEAAYKGNLPGFAAKEVNLSSTGMIRGLAQCTPDIVGPGCYRCLKASLNLRDSWVNTMVFLPSCLFQYDLYGTLDPPASPPPPRTFRAVYISPIVVVFVAVVIGGCWLWKRCTGSVSDETRRRPDVVHIPVANREDRKQGLPRYTFSEVEQMTNRFDKQIGKDAFGVVHLGHLGSKKVAVKRLNETEAPEQFANEISVFAKTSHKNLVSLLGYCEDRTRLALIYEYMDRGDLKGILSDYAGLLSWTDRLKIAIDVAEGLHYLHNSCGARIVHRDVKPANILINHNLEAKVADFGLSKIFPENNVANLETRIVCTHGYTAPEYSNTGMLDEKVDVYSFGVVLLELITGKTPSSNFNLVEWFLNRFEEGDIGQIFYLKQGLDDGSVWEAAELAEECVCKDPKKRPNMWNIISRLKKYLDREVLMTAGASSTSTLSTTMETASPISFGSIAMEPQAT